MQSVLMTRTTVCGLRQAEQRRCAAFIGDVMTVLSRNGNYVRIIYLAVFRRPPTPGAWGRLFAVLQWRLDVGLPPLEFEAGLFDAEAASLALVLLDIVEGRPRSTPDADAVDRISGTALCRAGRNSAWRGRSRYVGFMRAAAAAAGPPRDKAGGGAADYI